MPADELDDETREVVARAERAGVLITAPSGPRLTMHDLEVLGKPFKGAGPDVLRELDEGRG